MGSRNFANVLVKLSGSYWLIVKGYWERVFKGEKRFRISDCELRNGEAGKESLDRSAKGRTGRGEIGPISWDPGEEEVRHGESVLWRIEFRKEKGRIANCGFRIAE